MSDHEIVKFESVRKEGNNGYVISVDGVEKTYERSNPNHQKEIDYLDDLFDNMPTSA